MSRKSTILAATRNVAYAGSTQVSSTRAHVGDVVMSYPGRRSLSMPTIAESTGLVTIINVFVVEPSNQQKLLDILARATETAVAMTWSMPRRSAAAGSPPTSRLKSTAHGFICVAASMRRRYAACSTCWRSDDRFAAWHPGVARGRRDRYARRDGRAGSAGANDAGRESVLWSCVRVPRQAR